MRSEEELLNDALTSLSHVLQLTVNELRNQLSAHQICFWQNQPFVKGGYSYQTITSSAAKKILSEPVEGKIFFAGEGIYDGESQGTVEAALQSGKGVAEKIKALFSK
ncbi:MAG: FAD-dependent oxidoreductase [Agriterribacter sp.]